MGGKKNSELEAPVVEEPAEGDVADLVTPDAEIATPDETELVAEEQETPQVASVREGVAGAVAGERVEVSESLVGAMAAGEVVADETFILFGLIGNLSGDAKVLVDIRGAVVGGLVMTVGLGILGALLGRKRH